MNNYHVVHYAGDGYYVNSAYPYSPPAAYPHLPSPHRGGHLGGSGESYSLPLNSPSSPPPPRPFPSSYGPKQKCRLCSSPAELFCSRCKGVGYCSQIHLIDDEASHRTYCKVDKDLTTLKYSSLEEESDINKMQYVTSAPLNPGDTIVRLNPAMMAPHDKNLPGPSKSSLCLGCCRWFPTDMYKCPECRWPVCGTNCANNSLHSIHECDLFQSQNITPESAPKTYDAILVLRTLQQLDTEASSSPLSLAFHEWLQACGPQQTELWNLQKEVYEPIEHFLTQACRLKLSKFDQDLAEASKFLRQVVVFTLTNSVSQENPASVCDHRVDSVRTRNYHSAKYLFPTLHAFGRSCSPNASWTLNHAMTVRDANMHFWATRPINAADPITLFLEDPAILEYGSLERRQLLADPACTCPRCTDSTELDSMASAVRCKTCTSGFLLPADPLDPGSSWTCTTEGCQVQPSSASILKLLSQISSEVKETPNNIRDLQTLLKRHLSDLHSRHYLIARVADRIVQLTWACVKNQTLTSLATYNFKPCAKAAKLCLDFASHVSPGYTKHRARYIFIMQLLHGLSGTYNAVYHFCNEQPLQSTLIRKKFERIYKYQQECCGILQYEKPGSPLHNWLCLLQKCRDDVGELLRTTSRQRGFTFTELERLKKAFSYFTSRTHVPNLPKELQIDVSHIVIYQATPFRQEYKTFFEFEDS